MGETWPQSLKQTVGHKTRALVPNIKITLPESGSGFCFPILQGNFPFREIINQKPAVSWPP